jgi:hypothetical protein
MLQFPVFLRAAQAQLQHDSTLRTLLSVYLPQHTLASQAIKAQFNAGRSCTMRRLPQAAMPTAGVVLSLSTTQLKIRFCRRRSMLPHAFRQR